MEKTPSEASVLLTLIFAHYFSGKKTYNCSEQINCSAIYNKVNNSLFLALVFINLQYYVSNLSETKNVISSPDSSNILKNTLKSLNTH